MKILSFIPVFLIGCACIACNNSNKSGSNHPSSSEVTSQTDSSRQHITNIIDKVNQHWQKQNPNSGNAFWHHAAYHTGNLAAYHVTQNETYKDYTEKWAEQNLWKGARSDNKNEWKYSYGETDEYVLFGDWQICFQVYMDLYNMDSIKNENKIARAKEVMSYEVSTPQNDYWWWADGLYMVMPVMTKLYNITHEKIYLDKLYEYFSYTKKLLYDEEHALFYRDAKYVYPQHKTPNGIKDFWSRGNGWVFAALAKVLEELPANDPHKAEYLETFRKMAQSLASCQQPEGYWTRSLMDLSYVSGRETSGTAFFTYGLLWGINNHILDKTTYQPIADKAWNYLETIALQPDGTIGYVQPIGERADQHKNVGPTTTADFGVGAFLLAASEKIKNLQ